MRIVCDFMSLLSDLEKVLQGKTQGVVACRAACDGSSPIPLCGNCRLIKVYQDKDDRYWVRLACSEFGERCQWPEGCECPRQGRLVFRGFDFREEE